MRFAFILLLSATVSPAADPPKKEWVKVAPAGGGFQILFPGKPAESSRPPNISDPSRATQLFTLEAAKNYLFIASYLDLNSTPPAKDKEMKALEAVRDSQAAKLKGEVLKDIVVVRNGLSGRQYTMKIAANLYYRSVIFLKGRRVFQAYVLGSEAEITGKDVEKFLNSLEILSDADEKK
ncbi:MAG: hypothetical protein ACJ8F7_00120 [Gemmataceae bacterium]